MIRCTYSHASASSIEQMPSSVVVQRGLPYQSSRWPTASRDRCFTNPFYGSDVHSAAQWIDVRGERNRRDTYWLINTSEKQLERAGGILYLHVYA